MLNAAVSPYGRAFLKVWSERVLAWFRMGQNIEVVIMQIVFGWILLILGGGLYIALNLPIIYLITQDKK